MIGNQQDAAKAVEVYQQWYNDESTPDGWEYLGEGATRVAFLAPSGVVYKVQTSTYGHYNHNEYMIIMAIAIRPDLSGNGTFGLPKVGRYRVPGMTKPVLAMEFLPVSMRARDLTPREERIAENMGIIDAYQNNYSVGADNKVTFIDYGFSNAWNLANA